MIRSISVFLVLLSGCSLALRGPPTPHARCSESPSFTPPIVDGVLGGLVVLGTAGIATSPKTAGQDETGSLVTGGVIGAALLGSAFYGAYVIRTCNENAEHMDRLDSEERARRQAEIARVSAAVEFQMQQEKAEREKSVAEAARRRSIQEAEWEAEAAKQKAEREQEAARLKAERERLKQTPLSSAKLRITNRHSDAIISISVTLPDTGEEFPEASYRIDGRSTSSVAEPLQGRRGQAIQLHVTSMFLGREHDLGAVTATFKPNATMHLVYAFDVATGEFTISGDWVPSGKTAQK